MNNQLLAIARQLGFDTLQTRNSDRLDFREVAVWQVREALEAAYELGRAAGHGKEPSKFLPNQARVRGQAEGGPCVTTSPLFPLGQLVATPGALEVLAQSGQSPAQFLTCHARGDWGDVCAEDKRLNDEAVRDGGRILSAYTAAKGVRVWIVTEAADATGRRAATTILLPEEY